MLNWCLLRFGHFPYSSRADIWQMKFRCPLQAGLATTTPPPPDPSYEKANFVLTPSSQNRRFEAKRGFFPHPISFSESPCKPLEGSTA